MAVVSSTTVLQEPDAGPVLHICFRGEYPPGSEGNSVAKDMQRDLTSAIAESAPAAVIVDFSEVEYRWGDGICLIAIPLLRGEKSFLPACIVAFGETAEALAPLTGPNWLLGFAGVQLVGSVEEARRNLAARGG